MIVRPAQQSLRRLVTATPNPSPTGAVEQRTLHHGVDVFRPAPAVFKGDSDIRYEDPKNEMAVVKRKHIGSQESLKKRNTQE